MENKCRYIDRDTMHNEMIDICRISGVPNPDCDKCYASEPKPTAQDVMRMMCELDQVEFIEWFNLNFEAK